MAEAIREELKWDGKATHMIVMGEEVDWQAKGPWTVSGFSAYGGLEFCEPTKEVKCHECGRYVPSLGNHVRGHRNLDKHRPLTMREVKLRHGFARRRGLITVAQRAKMKARPQTAQLLAGRDAGAHIRRLSAEGTQARREIFDARREMGKTMVHSPEFDNNVARCQEQTRLEAFAFAAHLGRTPDFAELASYRNHYGKCTLDGNRLKRLFGVSCRQLFIQWGWKLRAPGVNVCREEMMT